MFTEPLLQRTQLKCMDLDPGKTSYNTMLQNLNVPFLSMSETCFKAGSTLTALDECFRFQWTEKAMAVWPHC